MGYEKFITIELYRVEKMLSVKYGEDKNVRNLLKSYQMPAVYRYLENKKVFINEATSDLSLQSQGRSHILPLFEMVSAFI